MSTGESTGKIYPELSAAFVSASLTFAPIYWIYYNSTRTRYPDTFIDLGAFILGGFAVWGICLLVILAALFIVAYPIERGLVARLKKPNALKAAGIYVGLMAGLGTGVGLLQLATPYPNDLPIVIGLTLVVGAPVAFVARLIYPILLPAKRTTNVLVWAIALTGALIPMIPHGSPYGSQTQQLFPTRGSGELARAVYLGQTKPSTEGMRNYTSPESTNQGEKYQITFSCNNSPSNSYKFQVTATDEKGDKLRTMVFNCAKLDGISSTTQDFPFGAHKTRVKLRMRPLQVEPGTKVPPAYAIITRVGSSN